MKKPVLILWMIAIFTTFSFAAAYADSFEIWKGKWFKIINKGSGYYTDKSGKMVSDKGNLTNYLQVWDVQEDEKILIVDWYDDAGNYFGEVKFYILGEHSLDFLCRFEISQTNGSSSFIGLTARIQGKIKGSDLTSGSFKSIGGFSWGAVENSGGYIEYSAANLTWNGTLIPESKVPFDRGCEGTEEGLEAIYSNGRQAFEGPINHGWGTSCPGDPPYEHNLYQDICTELSALPVDWADGGWTGSSDPTKFSVSWHGYIFAPVDGAYSFGGWVDGTVYVEINGEVVTNMDTKGSSYGGTVTLPGGRCVPISMSFSTNGGSNNMILNWRPPGATVGEVVPRTYLRHHAGA
jgi:hypothetical protein